MQRQQDVTVNLVQGLGGCNSDVVVRGVDGEDRFGEEGRGKGHFKPGH